MNTNLFTRDVTNSQISAADLIKIKNLSKAQINALIQSIELDDFLKTFGNPMAATVSAYRTAMISERLERTVQKPIEDGLLSSVWQGKMGIEMVPKKDAVEAVITSQEIKTHTGTGPVTTLKPMTGFIQRAVLYLSCYTKDVEGKGIVSTVDSQLAKIFPNLNLQGIADIAMILQAKRKALDIPASDTTGLKWQAQLIDLLGQFTEAEQVSLNNRILIEQLKQAKPDYLATGTTTDYTWIAHSNTDSVKQAGHTIIRNGKKVDIPLLAWTSDIKNVQMQLSVTANPNKYKCAFFSELGWAQATISALGASNIMALAAASGIMPGATEQEASTVRFVTVALQEFVQSRTLKVAAPNAMLLIFYYSLQAFLLYRGLDKKTATKTIQEKVHFSTVGLKAGALMSFRELFSPLVDPPSMQASSYVAWNPSKFASASDSAEVVRKSASVSAVFEQESKGYTRKFIFREVLEFDEKKELDRHLFLDGFPALFNFWSSNVKTMDAMIFKEGKYMSEPLKPLPAPHTQIAYSAAKQILAFPMQPFTTRSYRVMAVKGSKLLSVMKLEGIDDVLGKGNKEDEQGMALALSLVVNEYNPNSPAADYIVPPVPNNTQIAPPTTTTTQDEAFTVTLETVNSSDLF